MDETNLVDFRVLAIHLHVVFASLVHGILGDFHLFEISLKRCRFGCDVILERAKTQM